MAYSKISSSILNSDVVKHEIRLLKQGFRYYEISKITGTKHKTIAERNRSLYGIDIYSAFRKRIERDGIPNRLHISDNFGYYFIGLFDGEGHFGVFHRRREKEGMKYPEFRLFVQITLRDDDAEVLQYIQENLGGRLIHSRHKFGNSNPALYWRIEKANELAEIMLPLFDKYTLRTKKNREYKIWHPLVIERYIATLGGYARNGLGLSFEPEFLGAIERIKNIRKYPGGITV